MKKILLLVTCLLIVFSPLVHAGEIAIIVNKNNPTDSLSFRKLVRLLKAGQQYWEHGPKIYLILRESGSPEKAMILQGVYGMSEKELKTFWLAKIFRGEMSRFPKVLYSAAAVKKFVSRIPNAISFIVATDADEKIKVLKIDGKLPGDKGYRLKTAKD